MAHLASACAAASAEDENGIGSAESAQTGGAPAPSGTFHVQGASRSSYTILQSLNGDREESLGGSGVSRDGYYSWNTDAYDVIVKPNANGMLAISIGSASGTLSPGVNSYASSYTGELGTSTDGYRVTLSAGKWNSATLVVSELKVDLVRTQESIATRTYWERNPKGPPDRQVTARTRTIRWTTFQTGIRPGFHR